MATKEPKRKNASKFYKLLHNINFFLEKAYKFIKEDPNRLIFVHCVHGSSRSGSTVIFYLMKDKNILL